MGHVTENRHGIPDRIGHWRTGWDRIVRDAGVLLHAGAAMWMLIVLVIFVNGDKAVYQIEADSKRHCIQIADGVKSAMPHDKIMMMCKPIA